MKKSMVKKIVLMAMVGSVMSCSSVWATKYGTYDSTSKIITITGASGNNPYSSKQYAGVNGSNTLSTDVSKIRTKDGGVTNDQTVYGIRVTENESVTATSISDGIDVKSSAGTVYAITLSGTGTNTIDGLGSITAENTTDATDKHAYGIYMKNTKTNSEKATFSVTFANDSAINVYSKSAINYGIVFLKGSTGISKVANVNTITAGVSTSGDSISFGKSYGISASAGVNTVEFAFGSSLTAKTTAGTVSGIALTGGTNIIGTTGKGLGSVLAEVTGTNGGSAYGVNLTGGTTDKPVKHTITDLGSVSAETSATGKTAYGIYMKNTNTAGASDPEFSVTFATNDDKTIGGTINVYSATGVNYGILFDDNSTGLSKVENVKTIQVGVSTSGGTASGNTYGFYSKAGVNTVEFVSGSSITAKTTGGTAYGIRLTGGTNSVGTNDGKLGGVLAEVTGGTGNAYGINLSGGINTVAFAGEDSSIIAKSNGGVAYGIFVSAGTNTINGDDTNKTTITVSGNENSAKVYLQDSGSLKMKNFNITANADVVSICYNNNSAKDKTGKLTLDDSVLSGQIKNIYSGDKVGQLQIFFSGDSTWTLGNSNLVTGDVKVYNKGNLTLNGEGDLVLDTEIVSSGDTNSITVDGNITASKSIASRTKVTINEAKTLTMVTSGETLSASNGIENYGTLKIMANNLKNTVVNKGAGNSVTGVVYVLGGDTAEATKTLSVTVSSGVLNFGNGQDETFVKSSAERIKGTTNNVLSEATLTVTGGTLTKAVTNNGTLNMNGTIKLSGSSITGNGTTTVTGSFDANGKTITQSGLVMANEGASLTNAYRIRGNATGSSISISDGTLSGRTGDGKVILYGGYSKDGAVGGKDNGNSVSITDKATVTGVDAIYGGYGATNADYNKVVISAEKMGVVAGAEESSDTPVSVVGGRAVGDKNTTAHYNEVTITAGTYATGLAGGYAHYGKADNNKLTIGGAAVTKDNLAVNLAAGYGQSEANNNTLTIEQGAKINLVYKEVGGDGSIVGGVATGIYSVANENQVIIKGGTLNGVSGIAGGLSSIGNVSSNKVTVGGKDSTANVIKVNGYTISTYSLSVVGGATYLGSVKENEVTLATGTYEKMVAGGFAGGTANSNKVTISDGTYKESVYGGYSVSKNAAGNTVNISGGTFMKDIYASNAVSSDADKKNTITITGTTAKYLGTNGIIKADGAVTLGNETDAATFTVGNGTDASVLTFASGLDAKKYSTLDIKTNSTVTLQGTVSGEGTITNSGTLNIAVDNLGVDVTNSGIIKTTGDVTINSKLNGGTTGKLVVESGKLIYSNTTAGSITNNVEIKAGASMDQNAGVFASGATVTNYGTLEITGGILNATIDGKGGDKLVIKDQMTIGANGAVNQLAGSNITVAASMIEAETNDASQAMFLGIDDASRLNVGQGNLTINEIVQDGKYYVLVAGTAVNARTVSDATLWKLDNISFPDMFKAYYEVEYDVNTLGIPGSVALHIIGAATKAEANTSGLAAVQQGAMTVTKEFTGEIENHLGFMNKPFLKLDKAKVRDVASTNKDDYKVETVKQGNANEVMPVHATEKDKYDKEIWASYIRTKETTEGMKLGAGVEGNNTAQYNGAVVGVDFYSSKKAVTGLALSYAVGDIDSYSGNTFIRNKSKYYGVSFYDRVTNGNTALIYDIGYIRGDNDINQYYNGRDMTSDVKTDTYTAGVKYEAEFGTEKSRVVPFVSFRYIRQNNKDYTNSHNTRFEAKNQNLYIPKVGIAWTGDFAMPQSEWTWRPSVEAGYVWNLGDRSADSNICMGANVAPLEYDIVDKSSYYTKAGMEFMTKNFTVGLFYRYLKGNAVRNNKWNVNLSWSF